MVVEFGVLSHGLLEKTKIEQGIYFGKILVEQAAAVKHALNQFDAMIRAEERALNNLRGMTNVHSYAEFMQWYNRQLDIEREVVRRWDNQAIMIGNKRHSLSDINDIPNSVRTTYGAEYWEGEITPAQRREMWINLGVSPANYAFTKAWGEREDSIARILLTKREMLAEENARVREAQAKMLEETSREDASDRAINQASLNIAIDTNNVLRDQSMSDAEWREHQLAQQKRNDAPPPDADLSQMYNKELFTRQPAPGRFVN